MTEDINMLAIFLIFFATLYYCYWLLVVKRHPDNFPPGPRFPIPLLGDFIGFGRRPDLLTKLRKDYGDIVGMWRGEEREVVISGYDLLLEASAKDECLGRPQGIVKAELEDGGVPGIVFSSGQNWIEQRRYTLHILRNLGFGKNSMGDRVSEHAKELCNFLESTKEKPIDIRTEFDISILNALWEITSGETLSTDSTRLKDLVDLLDFIFKASNSKLLVYLEFFLPLLAKFTGGKLGNFDKLVELVEETVQDHEKTYQEENMRDFIDFYLRERYKQSAENDPSSFKGPDGKANMMSVLLDLFVAGAGTTSTILHWAMFFMVKHQEIQKKVQDEIDMVTGRSRLPSHQDRQNTQYTEAVIHEIFRMGNILPLAVPHYTSQGFSLADGKYFIPPKTTVIFNLGAVMLDPKNFTEPTKFDPGRHLSLEGKFVPHPKVIPFSLGKRRCLGESLAKMEFYVFFTTILSKFNLMKENDHEELSYSPIAGITTIPSPFNMKFIPRP